MNPKSFGALMVILGCTAFGSLLSISVHKEEKMLQHLHQALVTMESELTYHLTPLPDLCSCVIRPAGAVLGQVFSQLSECLQNQATGDVASCMDYVLSQHPELPQNVSRLLLQLGDSLGVFDLPGQLKGLQLCQDGCKTASAEIHLHIQEQTKCYRLLGGCVGAALVILLL